MNFESEDLWAIAVILIAIVVLAILFVINP
jgi:hypothetical protein